MGCSAVATDLQALLDSGNLSSAHGAGELPDLSRIAADCVKDDEQPWLAAARLDEMQSRTRAERYLRGLRDGAPKGRLRISDKSPLNFFHLALVAILFPYARVVHCTREAANNALSIWMENFNVEQRYATDFDDLAFFHAECRRLMAHGQAHLPLRMLELHYEDTVAGLEMQARRLVEFLGAPSDARCLDFHQQERAVQTPGRWQVRQPVYNARSRAGARMRHTCRNSPRPSISAELPARRGPGRSRWRCAHFWDNRPMPKSLTLALAQIKLCVGDVDGNVGRIIAAAQEARDVHGATLVASPELSLIGYPPDDLLLRSATPRVIAAGLQRLLDEVRGITLIVGLPEYVDEQNEAVIYNAAYVIRDGAVIAKARKQLLPNYGVFDERRHFKVGRDGTLVFTQDGVRIGLCICEDLWGPGPAAAARAGGADLLLNINASPFDLGKNAARRGVFAARSAETGLPIAYVNCVGGQDDVLFDGDSAAVQADGSLALTAPLFEEGVHALRFVDGQWQGGQQRADAPIEAVVYRGLVQSVRDYVNRNGFSGALIGLSGGIDSALVAAIASDALGPERVWGVSLPSRYTADMSNDDARLEAEALGIRYSILPIEPAYETFANTLAESFAGKAPDLTEENLQSRCRGVLLMALSNKFGPVVLTTGNKSEMAVGYSTLYGDMCGGFAPIKDVYKTFVYRLASWRNTISPPGKPVIPERVITRPPSAELRHDQKDSDSLPPYEVLDPILELYVENQLSIPEIVARGFELATVTRVANLVRRSEYKRRQAPPGPKVTRCAFGRERRYPLTAVYGEI